MVVFGQNTKRLVFRILKWCTTDFWISQKMLLLQDVYLVFICIVHFHFLETDIISLLAYRRLFLLSVAITLSFQYFQKLNGLLLISYPFEPLHLRISCQTFGTICILKAMRLKTNYLRNPN